MNRGKRTDDGPGPPVARGRRYRFLILYGSLYAGFGVQSPYLPILLDNRHLRPETIGLALAAGMAMRLMAAQAVARLADRLDAPKPAEPEPNR
jgi:PPP family 3-phenylpropionic acid transporter